MRGYPRRRGFGRRRRRVPLKTRLIIAAVIALMAFASFSMMRDENPITGEVQNVALDERQEVVLGLQAVPEMVRQHHGHHPDQRAQIHLDKIGARLLQALDGSLRKQGRQNPYPFDFHLLQDPDMVNAFALPGGQVFITAALYERLSTDGQLAGVVGHEIGHVLERHGAQRLAKQQLTQGLVGAAGVAGGDAQSAQLAQAIGAMVNMKYGRKDELESDKWGVRLTAAAGYDPRSMVEVMKVLEQASQGSGQPEFLSTHPKPANRIEYILAVIDQVFPNGVPGGLEP